MVSDFLAKDELQADTCGACRGAHRRHTCGGQHLLAQPPATLAPSAVPAVAPIADANGGTEKEAAAAAAAAAAAEGSSTEPTRVSHRRSAPPQRLVEDGTGRS